MSNLQKNISPPKLGRWFLSKFINKGIGYQVVGDFDELFYEILNEKGETSAKLWYWLQIIKSFPSFIKDNFFWGGVMFKNYLKISLRNFQRQKGYVAINIIGLAIGIACSILIFMYVQFELSYDTYHDDAENIYRVCKSRKTEAQLDLFAPNVIEVAPTLKELYPEVIAYGRIGTRGTPRVRYQDKYYIENKVMLADAGIFDIFKIDFLKGDKKTALVRPFTAVITKGIAQKYFGAENPIGKVMMLDTTAYEITAVVQDSPPNTHLKYTMLVYLDINHMGPYQFPWQGWHGMNYIKLRDGVDAAEFENKIRDLPHRFIGEELKANGIEFTLFLQKITDIHFYSNLKWEAEPPGNQTYVYIFGVVGIFILLIACFNFMNLATARSAKRACEVGVRKVIGAQRRQLITQFMSESFLMVFIAIIMAMILIVISLQAFNSLVESNYSISDFLSLQMLIFFTVLLLSVTFIAGSYPAIFLSRFKPAAVLGGDIRKGAGGSLIRKILVIGQFAISLILIIAALIFYNQMKYMLNTKLGFDKDQKLVLEFNRSMLNLETYEAVKNEFKQNHYVKGATFSSSVPGRWMYLWHMWPYGMQDTKDQMLNCFQVDYDFLKDYKIELAAGRSFDKEKGIDQPGSVCILNEAAVKAYGFSNQEALTHQINRQSNQIIGVAKDFHFRGLQEEIAPLLMFLMVEDFRYLTLSVDTENLTETMVFVESTYKRLCPEELYVYFFLDQDFNLQYQSELKLGKVFGVFTFLGIFIACLGLFGLASFLAEQKTKEIGIRKVLGASISKVVLMLNKEFIKWVLISNLLAWPIAYFAVRYWLQDFAYRIDIGWAPFLFAAIIVVVIAFVTVSYQSLKAAKSNPVDSLKYE